MSAEIAILLATYNSEQYLKPQLDSLLSQSYQNFTIYIRDDRSSDDTMFIIKEYFTNFPNKFILYENDGLNLGACKSFFSLLERTNSQYYMFCDHDDVWLPDKVEKTLALMKNTEKKMAHIPILAHTDLTVVDENLNVIASSFWTYSKLKQQYLSKLSYFGVCNGVTGCAMMINQKAKENSLPPHPQASMHDYWIALKTLQNGKVVFLETSTIYYRQHSKNRVGSKPIDFSYFLGKIKYWSQTIRIQKENYELLKEVEYGSIFRYYLFKFLYFIIRNL